MSRRVPWKPVPAEGPSFYNVWNTTSEASFATHTHSWIGLVWNPWRTHCSTGWAAWPGMTWLFLAMPWVSIGSKVHMDALNEHGTRLFTFLQLNLYCCAMFNVVALYKLMLWFSQVLHEVIIHHSAHYVCRSFTRRLLQWNVFVLWLTVLSASVCKFEL